MGVGDGESRVEDIVRLVEDIDKPGLQAGMVFGPNMNIDGWI